MLLCKVKHTKTSKRVKIIDWHFIGLESAVLENQCVTQGDCHTAL